MGFMRLMGVYEVYEVDGVYEVDEVDEVDECLSDFLQVWGLPADLLR